MPPTEGRKQQNSIVWQLRRPAVPEQGGGRLPASVGCEGERVPGLPPPEDGVCRHLRRPLPSPSQGAPPAHVQLCAQTCPFCNHTSRAGSGPPRRPRGKDPVSKGGHVPRPWGLGLPTHELAGATTESRHGRIRVHKNMGDRSTTTSIKRQNRAGPQRPLCPP